MPKGMVKATWASRRLFARRTCGTRAGPTRSGMLPGPWPKRRNWPWHSDRYTTTASAAPVSTAMAALATAAQAPPPPGSHDRVA